MSKSIESLEAELAVLKAENGKLTEKPKRKLPPISLKVSKKGALSVYGLGRYPVTLYSGQFSTLLGMRDSIIEFMSVNASKLKTK